MDWFPWYFTIYEQDTMHLNPYQDGCYRRLIDHYMKTRAPLPDNDAALARIIGDSEANWVAMASPLIRPFFTVEKDRLHLKRCDHILQYQDGKTTKLSESGKKGAEKRWNKVNCLDSHPIATPKATLKPIDSTIQVQDNTIQDKERKKAPPGFVLPDYIDEADWEDFVEMRRKHRGGFTDRAKQGIINKLEQFSQQGHNPKTILENSIRNSWKDVYPPKEQSNDKPTRASLADQAVERALARLENEESANLLIGPPVV